MIDSVYCDNLGLFMFNTEINQFRSSYTNGLSVRAVFNVDLFSSLHFILDTQIT